MPLKRDRVNQHKAIDYFLQRSRALFFGVGVGQ